MEAIPEDLKADLAKEPTVEVILGQTFRVWFDGQSAHDYWVRMTSDGLLLSPTRTSEATPGCLCQGNFQQIENSNFGGKFKLQIFQSNTIKLDDRQTSFFLVVLIGMGRVKTRPEF